MQENGGAMKKICDVCGKRAEGLGTCPTQFHDIIMCSSCYEGLRAFEKGRSVKTVQELEDKRLLAMSEMQEKAYPSRVIENVDAWFAERKQKLIVRDIAQREDGMLMTTCNSFAGYRITSYHGIVSGESVLGTGFASSWDASVSDMLGAESASFISKLKEARELARQRAVESCLNAGGNAMVGVDIEYTMFSSNMIGVIFNGTCVRVEKITEVE